ncbi:hypothetical protein COCNU_02G011550 [Cocos nucifera]|uniref:Protein kinase domain-containing protein n=1 Tax=Cocos nucifera TaxID=13894 RepID=A0A8K0I058_COCNU|nr:hypothetical protein COCNU_02G011550 [Cocos nucifera]
MSLPNHSPLLLLLVLLFFLSISTISCHLSTIAISHVSNNTIVCALLPSHANKHFDLNCTSIAKRVQRNYPSANNGSYTAIAAGNGFLCALGPTAFSDASSMHWWEFKQESGGNGSIPHSKRVYQGPPLVSLSAGDTHVCGLQGGAARKLDCWRWPQLVFPKELNFTDIAVAVGLAATAICFIVLRTYRNNGRVHDMVRLHGAAAAAVVPPPEVVEVSNLPIDRRLSLMINQGHSSTIEEFPLAVLLAATDNFSDDQKIGSGSFGSVYRATLDDGRTVAIKRDKISAATAAASSTSLADRRRWDRDREAAFLSELALLSRVNHKNLVRLLGFCSQAGERALVYEFMANRTLHDHLHKLAASPLASWAARLKVALDAARGIEYLHVYAVPPIIHRDIKPSNILLDATWTAKVADFGLSILSPSSPDDDDTRHVSSPRAAGTVGYMDPQYYRLQNLTAKSDVYSFGVVLLELLTGNRAVHRNDESGTPRNVVEYAVPHIAADDVHRVMDRRLPPPTPSEIEAVAFVGYLAADCVSPDGRDRPTMSEIVAGLERAVAACAAPPPSALPRSATARSV